MTKQNPKMRRNKNYQGKKKTVKKHRNTHFRMKKETIITYRQREERISQKIIDTQELEVPPKVKVKVSTKNNQMRFCLFGSRESVGKRKQIKKEECSKL